ncbi:MAG: PIN domain-containing protein [Gammaproteobacteria bacterium]
MTPDSSAIVAAFSPWHPLHEAARAALRGVSDLVAHAEVEAYSVLTRLPAPFRAEPALVAEYLGRRYPGSRLVLPAPLRRSLVGRLAAADVAGGRTYDALIGLTAREADRDLVTCDKRAVSVYERMGVGLRFLA